jgi:hypothetical protein
MYLSLYSPLLDLHRSFSFSIFYTVDKAPWTRDQPVAMPLHAHRTAQTQNKRTQDIHASSGFRTHDPSVRAGEDGSCRRPGATVIGIWSYSRSKICQNSPVLPHFFFF